MFVDHEAEPNAFIQMQNLRIRADGDGSAKSMVIPTQISRLIAEYCSRTIRVKENVGSIDIAGTHYWILRDIMSNPRGYTMDFQFILPRDPTVGMIRDYSLVNSFHTFELEEYASKLLYGLSVNIRVTTKCKYTLCVEIANEESTWDITRHVNSDWNCLSLRIRSDEPRKQYAAQPILNGNVYPLPVQMCPLWGEPLSTTWNSADTECVDLHFVVGKAVSDFEINPIGFGDESMNENSAIRGRSSDCIVN